MHLQTANSHIMGGSRPYEVKPDDHPDLPVVFDFDRPVACGTQVLMAMASAVGQTLHDGKVFVDRGRHTATVTARGIEVLYAPHARPQRVSVDEVKRIFDQTVTLRLGNVGPDGCHN